MADIWEIYADDIHYNFKHFYANWPPNQPIKLGDFGMLEDNLFRRKGNIKGVFNVDFQTRSGQAQQSDYEYKSAGSTELTFSAKGSSGNPAIPVNASLKIDFSSSDAIFFNAAGCNNDSIEDEVTLGKDILKLFKDDKWDDDWVIVTNLVTAGATTVVISSADAASLSLEADANISNINLSDASLRLGVKHEKNIGYKVVTQGGMIPLLGCSKLHRHLFSDPTLDPLSRFALLPRAATEYESMTLKQHLKDEKRPLSDAFHFGRVV